MYYLRDGTYSITDSYEGWGDMYQGLKLLNQQHTSCVPGGQCPYLPMYDWNNLNGNWLDVPNGLKCERSSFRQSLWNNVLCMTWGNHSKMSESNSKRKWLTVFSLEDVSDWTPNSDVCYNSYIFCASIKHVVLHYVKNGIIVWIHKDVLR